MKKNIIDIVKLAAKMLRKRDSIVSFIEICCLITVIFVVN
jgi:hypothetical protein